MHAPGRCSDRARCPQGDAMREPYLCAHNVLRSHLAATVRYNRVYRAQQQGQIGFTTNANAGIPWDPFNPRDHEVRGLGSVRPSRPSIYCVIDWKD